MKQQRAFTLIELLVVIAIIGLLASIVVVNVNSARDKAKRAKAIQELDAFRQALTLYEGDNGKFPDSGNCGQEGQVSDCLLGALAPYSGNLPATDPWGNVYVWHNPHCCVSECVMVLSGGPDGILCKGLADQSWVGCEHSYDQTTNYCSKPNSGDDDLGIYFGQVGNH